ncbi:MAG: aminoacetone oxidase family FAD-binding enzyme, partial [Rhizobacter sp.]|nr:aminoacetone oxidase family FAD-binding enzyme [Rhizobacter sp.]
IGWHEKHRGQLFCDDSSAAIIAMLVAECDAGGVARWQPSRVDAVRREADAFSLETSRGTLHATRVVVATGGLSIPKIGATDWGHVLARGFGHRIVEPRPALVPFVCDGADWQAFANLAGVALPVQARATARNAPEFADDLLFTHRGLSGPAALQVSTWWRPGEPIAIDLAPGRDLAQSLAGAKTGRRHVGSVLADLLPRRLADACVATMLGSDRPVAAVRDRALAALAAALHRWTLTPSGTEGWKKAEVTAGGVDTRELDSRSLESRLVPGLHFIGEVVDVTGWLGGYNFQWAWASAAACARAIAAVCPGTRRGL